MGTIEKQMGTVETVHFVVEDKGGGSSIAKLTVCTVPVHFIIVPTTVPNGS